MASSDYLKKLNISFGSLSTQLAIRKGIVSDAKALEEIEKACFSSPWTYESLEKDLKDNPRAIYIVAELEYDKIIAYMSLWNIAGEGDINNVAVLPEYRGFGISSLLLEEMIKICREEAIEDLNLEVRESNIIAQNLYGKFAFKAEGLRKGYYEDNGENAIIMWRRGGEVYER